MKHPSVPSPRAAGRPPEERTVGALTADDHGRWVQIHSRTRPTHQTIGVLWRLDHKNTSAGPMVYVGLGNAAPGGRLDGARWTPDTRCTLTDAEPRLVAAAS